MDAAKTVTATFTLLTYAMNVTVAGTGTGTVTSNPVGISCPGTCTYLFNYNQSVTLTAAGTLGSTFTGWSGTGGCSGSSTTCTVPMTVARDVTATFTPGNYLLTISKLGSTGTGSVQSVDGFISCDPTCTHTYVSPTVVTLTAAAFPGSTFAGWSGAGCTGTGSCVVTMDAIKIVTATFTLNSYALNVTKAGTGLGTVTSSSTPPGNPADINCGTACSASFPQSTVVTLTATATAGSTFIGWTVPAGTCTGTVTPCTVTMSAITNVTATFNLATTYTITGNTGTVGGVTLSYFDVTEKTVISDATLHTYTITVPAGWIGTVTPSLAGYLFSPESVDYNFVTLPGNKTQNYVATVVPAPKDYYVNNTGTPVCNDLGTGTSPTAPFCTLGTAATAAHAGDTVHVLAGTYAETVKPHLGQALHPITFVGSRDGLGVPLVTITGNGVLDTGSAFRLSAGQNYIVIDGFNVTGTMGAGIYATGSDHLTIQNNHVSYSGNPLHLAQVPVNQNQHGIYLSGTTNSTINGNTTDHNSWDGIRLINASNNNTVSNNVSFANAKVTARNAEGIDVETNSTGNTIIHNTTYANEDSGLNFYTGSSNNLVIGNVTYGNGDHGIDNNASPNNIIIGNTVQGNVTAGINVEGDVAPGSGGATIMNNIAVNNGLRKVVGGGTSTGEPGNIRVDSQSATSTIVDYNLYYLTEGTVQLIFNGVYYTSVVGGAGGQELHALEADPLLTAPAPIAIRPAGVPFGEPVNVGDYHIQTGSPAIDSANSLAPNEPALDRDGNPRVDIPTVPNTGNPPTTSFDDRGAYEAQLATVTLDPLSLSQAYDATPKSVTFVTVPTPLTVSVTYNGSLIVPTNAGSYAVVATVTQPGYSGLANGTLVITPKVLTVTGITAASKIYDATTSAILNFSAAALVGNLDGANAVLNTAAATGAFTPDAIVGVGKTVQVSGLALTGTASGNYTLTQPTATADITPKALTVTGVTASNKVYDGTTVATINPSLGVLVGNLDGTNVILETASATGAFTPDGIVGVGKTVQISGLTLSGTASGNYTLTQPTATADITAKALTVTGITASAKVYDGTTAATLNFSAAALVGNLDGTNVVLETASATGAFTPDGNVGVAKTVQISGLTLSGLASGNYSLTQPTTVADILKAEQIITVTTHAPASATNGLLFTVAATGGASGNPIVYSAFGGCTNIGPSFLVNSDTTACAVMYDQAESANYNAAPRITEFVNSVGTPPVITLNPVGTMVNAGQVVSFTAAATGTPNPTVQWQVSTDSGATWNNITGATSIPLSFTAALSNYGDRYRAVFTNTAGITPTTAATLTVNSVPVIAEGASTNVTMSENGSPTPFSLTLNASDADGDPLTWSISMAALHGTATASGTGPSRTIGYTPNTDYNGSDSFEVQVSDGNGGLATIIVNVTIIGVNAPPVITEGAIANVTMSEDGSPTAFALTLHATDVEGDTLTWSISTAALHGTATASGTGTSKAIGYTPAANFNGTDSFEVQVSDGKLGIDTIIVNVTIQAVNDAPVIAEGATTSVFMSRNGSPTAFSLTLHASDVDGDPITWSISTAASHGTATASGTGLTKVISYTPTTDYLGTDSFVVQVSDGLGGTTSITVNVTISLHLYNIYLPFINR